MGFASLENILTSFNQTTSCTYNEEGFLSQTYFTNGLSHKRYQIPKESVSFYKHRSKVTCNIFYR